MKTILIVDDKAENRYLLEKALAGSGYATLSSMNGAEALAIATQTPPDLVISDILMPVMDGFSLCRAWKKSKVLASIPFVFYTATYTDQKDEEFALELGAECFIPKPMDLSVLVKTIHDILAASTPQHASKVPVSAPQEEVFLKEYNEALVRKLEDKMIEVEAAEKLLRQKNAALEEEIQKRRETEAILRESEERYRLIFENSLDGILLTMSDGKVLSANPAFCRLVQRTEEEICHIGRSGLVDAHDATQAPLLEERLKATTVAGELRLLRRDGTLFPAEVTSAVYVDRQGETQTSMIVRDISERKRTEAAMVASLNEKEALLKEMHHRVKNNLQIISSLLNLQSRGVLDAAAQDAFADSMRRIRSMALVHESLYKSTSLAAIEFKHYLTSLGAELLNANGRGRIALSVDGDAVCLDIEQAIPCGLIANELISNALKHAFKDREKGVVDVHLTKARDGKFHLRVEDDGVGIPKGVNIAKADSLGMTLVQSLVDQLGGTLEVDTGHGTRITVSFALSAGRRAPMAPST